MKKNMLAFCFVLIVLSCVAVGLCYVVKNVILDTKENNWESQNVIVVNGTSRITVIPTIAYVDIGVTTFDETAAVAQSENAEKMKLVYAALAGLGIDSDKIKTIAYNISPRYDYTEYTSKLAGYDVTNGIQVTVMDLAVVSEVLDMTVKQGINRANSISFGITDEEKDIIYKQALAEAVANAETKAGVIAKAAGVTIDKPTQITEGSPVYDV